MESFVGACVDTVVVGLTVEGEVLSLAVGVNHKGPESSLASDNVNYDGTQVGTVARRTWVESSKEPVLW